MTSNSLIQFSNNVSKLWGPLSPNFVMQVRSLMQELILNSQEDDWLLGLVQEACPSKVLYKDPKHGFLLLAHSEKVNTYRSPHNHGSGWVIYGVCAGEVQMGIYHQHLDSSGEFRIIKKDSYPMRIGDCKAYLPGDIHDTKCLSPSTLMLRLTSHDFEEEVSSGRMIRFKEVHEST